MHILKIKNQFNTIFIIIMILALLSFFTANLFVNKVTSTYENVLDNSLPIINKSSQAAQLAAQIEAHLIQLHFDAINNTDKNKINPLDIEKLSQQWKSIQSLLTELSNAKVIDNAQILKNKKDIEEYILHIPQLLEQINLLIHAKVLEDTYVGKIETIINYNDKILLTEIESYWKNINEIKPTKVQLEELEYSNQFYKNSAQLLSYFRQVFLTKSIPTLNILKRNSVILFKKMENSGSNTYEYKLFSDTLLDKIKPIYAGKESLFKVRYDVLRLTNVTNSLIQQQIDTVKELEEISDVILVKIHNSLAQEKTKIRDSLYRTNKYLVFMIVVSFLISFFAVWFLVNKNLIKRITNIREKILDLAKGNTQVVISTYKEDEIGDMEEALGELKGYVKKAKLLSTTDPLTGLLNHTQFKSNLNIEIRRHSRQSQSLSLAIIDIDYFKNYNDLYGHPQGDVCLKKIAQLISKVCQRAGENAYRVGGEEFAIIMPNTTAQEQHSKIEQLQKLLEEAHIQHEDSLIAEHVTLSIGIYSSSKNKLVSADEFYQKADSALYQAKEKRNHIVVTQLEV